jgi:pSer/pThr/pTyr-binding forkhead associated (FHA) protein
MTLALVLFALRLLSAVLLVAFLGLITWFIYRDWQALQQLTSLQHSVRGRLRVVKSRANGLDKDTILPLVTVTRVGRSPANTVMIEDQFVSAEHALIILRGDQWWLEDLGSRNGTLLNGMQVDHAVVISAGDIIGIGSVELKVEPNGA